MGKQACYSLAEQNHCLCSGVRSSAADWAPHSSELLGGLLDQVRPLAGFCNHLWSVKITGCALLKVVLLAGL